MFQYLVIFGTEIKLSSDLDFGVKPATEGDDIYTGKEQSLKSKFVRTRIKMVSDRMKASYDRAVNAEGFQEGQLVPHREKCHIH